MYLCVAIHQAYIHVAIYSQNTCTRPDMRVSFEQLSSSFRTSDTDCCDSFYRTFGAHLPPQLHTQLADLKKRLEGSDDNSHPPTFNAKLLKWVDEMRELLQPSHVQWCSGDQQEYDELCEQLVQNGTFVRLKKRTNCYLGRQAWPCGCCIYLVYVYVHVYVWM